MNDLDRQAAELVMGWTEECDDDTQAYMWMSKNKIDGEPQFEIYQRLWQPSINISQALGNGGPGTIVGRMRELGFVGIELRRGCVSGKWSMAWAMDEPGLWRIGPEADTPAAAITEAAVWAMKGEGNAG